MYEGRCYSQHFQAVRVPSKQPLLRHLWVKECMPDGVACRSSQCRTWRQRISLLCLGAMACRGGHGLWKGLSSWPIDSRSNSRKASSCPLDLSFKSRTHRWSSRVCLHHHSASRPHLIRLADITSVVSFQPLNPCCILVKSILGDQLQRQMIQLTSHRSFDVSSASLSPFVPSWFKLLEPALVVGGGKSSFNSLLLKIWFSEHVLSFLSLTRAAFLSQFNDSSGGQRWQSAARSRDPREQGCRGCPLSLLLPLWPAPYQGLACSQLCCRMLSRSILSNSLQPRGL